MTLRREGSQLDAVLSSGCELGEVDPEAFKKGLLWTSPGGKRERNTRGSHDATSLASPCPLPLLLLPNSRLPELYRAGNPSQPCIQLLANSHSSPARPRRPTDPVDKGTLALEMRQDLGLEGVLLKSGRALRLSEGCGRGIGGRCGGSEEEQRRGE